MNENDDFKDVQNSKKLKEEEAKKLIDSVLQLPFKEGHIKIDTPEFDKRISEHINEIDRIPDPVKEPCEESSEMCAIFTECREKAKKVLEAHKSNLDLMETEINFKLTMKEKELIKQKSKEYGFKNLSDYMRVVLLNAKIDVSQNDNLKTKYDDEKYGDLYYFIDKFIKDPTDTNFRRLRLMFDSLITYHLVRSQDNNQQLLKG